MAVVVVPVDEDVVTTLLELFYEARDGVSKLHENGDVS